MGLLADDATVTIGGSADLVDEGEKAPLFFCRLADGWVLGVVQDEAADFGAEFGLFGIDDSQLISEIGEFFVRFSDGAKLGLGFRADGLVLFFDDVIESRQFLLKFGNTLVDNSSADFDFFELEALFFQFFLGLNNGGMILFVEFFDEDFQLGLEAGVQPLEVSSFFLNVVPLLVQSVEIFRLFVAAIDLVSGGFGHIFDGFDAGVVRYFQFLVESVYLGGELVVSLGNFPEAPILGGNVIEVFETFPSEFAHDGCGIPQEVGFEGGCSAILVQRDNSEAREDSCQDVAGTGHWLGFGLGDAFLQGFDDMNVFEGGDVPGDGAGGDEFFEEAAHDFAGTGFGEGGGEVNFVGAGDGANCLCHVGAEFLIEFGTVEDASFQSDEGDDALAFDFVGAADDCGFGDCLVGDEGGFDFGGAEAMAGNVENIIETADDPEVAFLITEGSVAGGVFARDSRSSRFCGSAACPCRWCGSWRAKACG